MLDWFKARLSEPSTYAAISGGLAAIGVSIGLNSIAAICAGVAAVLGIVLHEKTS